MIDTQVYINELFADSIYQEFNQTRFGIDGCKKRLDPDLAYEMKYIYERGLERQNCNLPAANSCCGYNTVKEFINTL